MTCDATKKKLFLIGSMLNDEESLIVGDENGTLRIHYDTFGKAKSSFEPFYQILLAPSFKPSIPPSNEELRFHHEFMRLIAFNPIILEFDTQTYQSDLISWRKKKTLIFESKNRFYSSVYFHCPMKSGFLKAFGVFDIARDIETTPFIGPDGKMVVRINEVIRSQSGKAESPFKSITREEIDKILKDRGYI